MSNVGKWFCRQFHCANSAAESTEITEKEKKKTRINRGNEDDKTMEKKEIQSSCTCLKRLWKESQLVRAIQIGWFPVWMCDPQEKRSIKHCIHRKLRAENRVIWNFSFASYSWIYFWEMSEFIHLKVTRIYMMRLDNLLFFNEFRLLTSQFLPIECKDLFKHFENL